MDYFYDTFENLDGKVTRTTGPNQDKLGYEFFLPLSDGTRIRVTLTSEEIKYMKREIEETIK